MVAPDVVASKLAALTERIGRIEAELPGDEARFLADRRAQELVSFNFLLAVQEALDLAAHVVSDAGWSVPATAREHFDLLADHGLVSRDLADALGGCAGARNLVAHHYGRLDLARLYREIPGGVLALKAFAVAMSGPTNP